jgi:hypothetical protein
MNFLLLEQTNFLKLENWLNKSGSCSLISLSHHVKWVPCQNGMARPQVADEGEGLQIWSVAANILNKQLRTADRGWSSSLGVGRGANNHPP